MEKGKESSGTLTHRNVSRVGKRKEKAKRERRGSALYKELWRLRSPKFAFDKLKTQEGGDVIPF